MEAEQRTRIARDAGLMMFLILVSRLLGFVRERAVAQVFGRTTRTDVFNAAFNVPDLMYFLLVGGALSAAFIPVFTEYLAKGEEREGWYVASTFMNLAVVLLVLFAVLGIIFAPALAPLVAYKFQGEERRLLVLLMRVMFPAVFFTAMAGLGMGVLNSYRHFTTPVIGPIFYNIAITLGAYLLGPRMGVLGMALGTLAGAIGNFLIQVPFVLQKNKGYYRFVLDVHHPGIKKMAQLMVPALVGLSIFQINLTIGTNLASALPEGSITALRLSNRLMQFPLGVFAMGISTVIFPTMTRQVARGELGEFVSTFSQGLRTVFFVTIPSTAVFLGMGIPIVRLLFETGEFTSADTAATAHALFFYAFGLFSQSGIQVLTKVFYSMHDTRTPVKIGFLSIALNTALSILFLRTTGLGAGGLALAFSITSIVNFVVFLFLLRRRLGNIEGWRMLGTIGRSAAAALVTGVVVYLVADGVGGEMALGSSGGRLVQVGLALVAGGMVYAALAWVFRMSELHYLSLVLSRKWRSPSRKPDL